MQIFFLFVLVSHLLVVSADNTFWIQQDNSTMTIAEKCEQFAKDQANCANFTQACQDAIYTQSQDPNATNTADCECITQMRECYAEAESTEAGCAAEGTRWCGVLVAGDANCKCTDDDGTSGDDDDGTRETPVDCNAEVQKEGKCTEADFNEECKQKLFDDTKAAAFKTDNPEAFCKCLTAATKCMKALGIAACATQGTETCKSMKPDTCELECESSDAPPTGVYEPSETCKKAYNDCLGSSTETAATEAAPAAPTEPVPPAEPAEGAEKVVDAICEQLKKQVTCASTAGAECLTAYTPFCERDKGLAKDGCDVKCDGAVKTMFGITLLLVVIFMQFALM